MSEQTNKEAIIEIKGDLKLLNQKIDLIKDNHLAHMAQDIDKLSKLIENLGGSIVNSPQTSLDGNLKVMYCHDIDGIIVELVQEL